MSDQMPDPVQSMRETVDTLHVYTEKLQSEVEAFMHALARLSSSTHGSDDVGEMEQDVNELPLCAIIDSVEEIESYVTRYRALLNALKTPSVTF